MFIVCRKSAEDIEEASIIIGHSLGPIYISLRLDFILSDHLEVKRGLRSLSFLSAFIFVCLRVFISVCLSLVLYVSAFVCVCLSVSISVLSLNEYFLCRMQFIAEKHLLRSTTDLRILREIQTRSYAKFERKRNSSRR